MKHNMFGEPRPANYAEIIEALDETGRSGDECSADVEYADDQGEFKGWTADVRDSESGDSVFGTLGYADKGDLLKDLKAAGITDINEL
jgi:hypothetical protein